ncbi:hypothetical protein PR002_g106 [Phytophthora rubi]|uniref:HECT domain-containing protein n=1 Tax=Phytophthora rubi TaxID=129364 RepID=A0A6A3P5C4_9STRA|nr:hypothetical protein PR002_g106 [Phytophthora rubi]
MTVSLSSYAKTIAKVSESGDEPPAFRAVALADVWNCAHSLDSISGRVFGLENVSTLIMVLNDASCADLNHVREGAIAGLLEACDVHRQVYDIAWILLRLFAEEIFDYKAAAGTSDTSWKQPLDKMFNELCSLYKHFAAKDIQASDASEKHDVAVSSDEAIYRLMCTVASKIQEVYEWPEAFGWWIQNAIDLVTSLRAVSTLRLAGIRLLRYALDTLGDAMFELSITAEYKSGQKIVLGLDIQEILLKRVGEMVSPIPNIVEIETVSALTSDTRDNHANYCAVIFRNELALDKLVDATNTVGEPDISSLNIPFEVSGGQDTVEKAVTEAVAECTAAQATMKHPSRTTSEVRPVSDISLDGDAIQALEPLVVSFCSVVNQIYEWTSEGENDDVEKHDAPSAVSLLRWELACALIQSFASMVPNWPSLFDNQVISTNGNCPAILFQLAQLCVRDLKVEDIADMRALLWRMEWLRSREMHFSLATRPISSSSFTACDEKAAVLRPPISALDELSSSATTGSDGALSLPEPSEYFYNLYAFSSCTDLPQHTGRNKMLEYWEKNVIPAIETYVSGSFKSYEMDYFFAQLREPLREGNAAAALKIAFTLCDGHVPSGCQYPDPDTDWSALQIDDVEVGGRYVIASEHVDVAGWSREMLWTLGHSGAVRIINPSGMVLLQLINPTTSAREYWWYHVDNLRSMSSNISVSEQSVTDFEVSRLRLKAMNQQLIYSLARKSVFDLLQVAPEHAMKLSIETRKTSLVRTSSSPFPLPSSSSAVHSPSPKAIQLAAPLPKDLSSRYNLADLLKLAASADLGCPEKVLSSEMGTISESPFGGPTESSSCLYLRPKVSPKTALITVLQAVLNKQFERAAATPLPPVMDRSTSYDENASVMVTMPAKKHKKRGKHGALAGKMVTSSTSAAGSSTSLKSTQPKLQQPDVIPALSTRKYRYLLVEALLTELKASLDLSSAFLRSRSLMVTSDSPPQPLILIHVPDATCLVLSFAVHPVLMDLPAGSSLEFFRDERCTDRLFGYFGDKRGLSYLPPLVVPGDKCYVRMSQGSYARYKFRVDAFTADFGLALWLCEEIYQKLLSVQLSHYEVETILTTALNVLVEYLIATTACLPSNAKTAIFQITAKLINFALGKGAMHAVPVAKLSSLVRELTFVYDNERTTQKGLYSLFTQQLAELISLVEEVSSLKGGSSSILGGAWWKEYVRMAVFTRVLAQGKREIATPDAFKRIYCGRAPIREIETAHRTLASHDLFSERILFLQNLPRTLSIADLEANEFAALAGMTKGRAWDALPREERMSKLVSADTISKIVEKPLSVYKWMRSYGYDLQFELSHYGSKDDALEAQAKWSHQMDCQLIAVCRELSGRMGVLMLTDLCPSHLNAKHAREYSLLASLETRDLRLRLSVLQSLNKLLMGALPLVNLRLWSDPSSLRSRIVSIRQLIFPGVKIRFFAQTQDNTTLAHSVFVDTNTKRPVVTIDRRKIAGKRGGVSYSATDASPSLLTLRDPKRSLFAATMKQLSGIPPSLLRAKRPTGASDPFVSFIVIFAGENVVGEGGPYRQLFNDISNELLASGNPLFIPTQNNVMKAGEFRERFMPKPSSTSKELLQMFEFVGILMGCCLRTGVRLNLRLAPLVWKMLVKQNLVLADLESVDHSMCESLNFLEELASTPNEDPDEVLFDSFSTTLSDGTIVELKSGGQHLPVTKANAKEYIRLVKATRLQECKPQVDAMLRGLGKIVPVQLLQLCVWSELQQWVLSSFSEENKRRFINFAWGQDTLPADDAEFDRTHTRLLIKAPPQDDGVVQDALLPKADTCFFNIELPVYSSEEIMREKLLLAITLCTSLDGDEQTAGHDIYYAGDEVDDDGM